MGADNGLIYDSLTATLQLGIASTTSGKLLFRNSSTQHRDDCDGRAVRQYHNHAPDGYVNAGDTGGNGSPDEQVNQRNDDHGVNRYVHAVKQQDINGSKYPDIFRHGFFISGIRRGWNCGLCRHGEQLDGRRQTDVRPQWHKLRAEHRLTYG